MRLFCGGVEAGEGEVVARKPRVARRRAEAVAVVGLRAARKANCFRSGKILPARRPLRLGLAGLSGLRQRATLQRVEMVGRAALPHSGRFFRHLLVVVGREGK